MSAPLIKHSRDDWARVGEPKPPNERERGEPFKLTESGA